MLDMGEILSFSALNYTIKNKLNNVNEIIMTKYATNQPLLLAQSLFHVVQY